MGSTVCFHVKTRSIDRLVLSANGLLKTGGFRQTVSESVVFFRRRAQLCGGFWQITRILKQAPTISHHLLILDVTFAGVIMMV